jgi:predicted amidohydrolase YtcJ
VTHADYVLVAQGTHDFTPGADAGQRVLAVAGNQIVGAGQELSDVSALVGDSTRVVECPDLWLLPSFFDTHNHLLWTSRDITRVDVSGATSIEGLLNALRDEAARTPPGDWVVASRRWHESLLDEARLPTAAELDTVSRDHPIFLPRGGHVATVNSRALELAGIDSSTPDPQGGSILRDGSGAPNGHLVEFPATALVASLLPPASQAERTDNLRLACARYNALGIGAVRDPGVTPSELATYQALHQAGELSLRAGPMLLMDPASDVSTNIALLDEMRQECGTGDDMLRVDSVKIFADGGVEGGWLSDPYTSDPDYYGHPFYDHGDLFELVDHAVQSGWKVGCHAVGDRAVEMVVGTYERVIEKRGRLTRGTLVMEHAFFADSAIRRRAVDAGIRVTVQPPLLYALAGNMVRHWGAERTGHVMPVAQWLADGAELAGGSDCNVAPLDPLLSVWGFVTRGTQAAGVQGPESAIDRETAFRLYTADAARLIGQEHRRGGLGAGYLADLIGFTEDPLTCDIDRMPELRPVLTIVDGKVRVDDHRLFPAN